MIAVVVILVQFMYIHSVTVCHPVFFYFILFLVCVFQVSQPDDGVLPGRHGVPADV